VRRWSVALAVAAPAVAIAIVGGLDALVVYLFFAAIVGAVVYGAGVGGDWIRDASRSRFDRNERDR
jgi:hypothetical protein